MKIFTCEFGHEASTFAVGYTDFKTQTELRWLEGQEAVNTLRGGSDYISGFIKVADERNIELVHSFATMNAGPVMLDETFEYFVGRLSDELKAVKNEVDAIALALHGGGATETLADPEGEVLRRVREIVGDDMPIAVSLDLHTNFTAEMDRYADIIVSNTEYPHTDSAEVAEEALLLLLEKIENKIKPVTRFKRIPLLMMYSTVDGAPKEIKDFIKEYRMKNGLLSASFNHGFPYADIPNATPSIYVITDNDEALAEKACNEIAEKIWSLREELQLHMPDATGAVDAALDYEGNGIVIHEASDNPGAGTPGDGTHLLKELLKRNIEKTAFGFICDAESVEKAVAAGVGARVDLEIGGKSDDNNLHGEPIKVVGAYVKSISDGVAPSKNPMLLGQVLPLGTTVRLVIGNVDVIITTNRSQTFCDAIYELHGIYFKDYKFIALKSANHFKGYFKDTAAKIITCDTPGASTLTWTNLDYKHISRPIYPLDKNVSVDF